jgi:hypothetical protein
LPTGSRLSPVPVAARARCAARIAAAEEFVSGLLPVVLAIRQIGANNAPAKGAMTLFESS